MRVLHVSRNYHPHAGGTEQFIASLARHTRGLGVESAVLCTNRHPAGEAPQPEIPVLRVPTFGPERLQWTRHMTGEMHEALGRADVLHFHDLRFGLDLPRRARVPRTVPRVLSTHGLIFHTSEHALLKRLAWHFVYRPTLRRLDAVVADSEHDYAAVATLPDARVLENPVDVDDFLTIADEPVARSGPLLYFGRITANKGLELLVPVLERDPSLRLVVVGTGDPRYVDMLHRTFDASNVEFAGPLPRGAMLDRLRGASAIVLPSRSEGFGITLVEAMATGRPVVAASIPPYRALAVGSDVGLVDCEDADALAGAIHAARGASAPVASVARARTFSWVARAPEFVALYDELIAGAAARA